MIIDDCEVSLSSYGWNQQYDCFVPMSTDLDFSEAKIWFCVKHLLVSFLEGKDDVTIIEYGKDMNLFKVDFSQYLFNNFLKKV